MSLIPSGKLTCSGVFTFSGGDMFEIIRRALEALLSLPREVSPTPGSYPQCVIRENGKVVLLLCMHQSRANVASFLLIFTHSV
jgi:hypothetical protein